MTTREAKTIDDICSLPRDNVATADHWIIFDENTVTIAAQVVGAWATEKIVLPRSTFEAFIDWYNTGE